jgi:hypothetical protein
VYVMMATNLGGSSWDWPSVEVLDAPQRRRRANQEWEARSRGPLVRC